LRCGAEWLWKSWQGCHVRAALWGSEKHLVVGYFLNSFPQLRVVISPVARYIVKYRSNACLVRNVVTYFLPNCKCNYSITVASYIF
jgi:hypothetical protein